MNQAELVKKFVHFAQFEKHTKCRAWMGKLTQSERDDLYAGLRVRWQTVIEDLDAKIEETK